MLCNVLYHVLYLTESCIDVHYIYIHTLNLYIHIIVYLQYIIIFLLIRDVYNYVLFPPYVGLLSKIVVNG